MVKPIPEGYHSITPYLVVDDANAAIEFYTRAFGGKEKFRLPMGDRIGHAELEIGDSVVMLADEFPEQGHLSPKGRGGTSVSLLHYVEDVDSALRSGRWKTSSGATGWAPLKTRSAISGAWPATRRRSPRKRCSGGWSSSARARSSRSLPDGGPSRESIV